MNTEPMVGVVEWFRPGEQERVEEVLADLQKLQVRHLRTGVSWADWLTPDGEHWYAWLLPRLAHEVEIVPCFLYTPPSLGVEPKTSSPPRTPKAFADFLDGMITRFGAHFEWVELWNEANNLREWDVRLDPQWLLFCEMVGGAAYWAKQRGKKTLLGGMSPIDPNWLRLMFERGVMAHIDAVGLHGFPDTFEYSWEGWAPNLARVQQVLDAHDSEAAVWITEVGYSTWRHDERRQLDEFVQAIRTPVERVYWYAGRDLDPREPTVDGFHSDEREYHFGLKTADNVPKLLFRVWEDGLAKVAETAALLRPAPLPGLRSRRAPGPVLITGGAGFIGTNLAHRLLGYGGSVVLFDNLARAGVLENVRWLRHTHGERAQIEVADVRDRWALERAVACAETVFHFAAQVAVTTSLTGPVHDFDVNARGTLNLLEALRVLPDPPPLVFTSTNKVYGDLEDIALHTETTRYVPCDAHLRAHGVDEDRPLSFHSPYGCSKGTADQYVLDYARTFGLPTVVLRLSCVYGPHQCGNEDQGWITHFLRRALANETITLYGDGKQVRDALFVDDLVDAFLQVREQMQSLRGRVFNLGGGPQNTLSLLELIDLIGNLHGARPVLRFEGWRSGDQRYFVSDTRRFGAATGWAPSRGISDGVEQVYRWLCHKKDETTQWPKPCVPPL